MERTPRMNRERRAMWVLAIALTGWGSLATLTGCGADPALEAELTPVDRTSYEFLRREQLGRIEQGRQETRGGTPYRTIPIEQAMEALARSTK